MFLDNLSLSTLHLCDERKLTYESLADLCDLSSKFIGKIARKQAVPTVNSLEKICSGLDVTPNELLLFDQLMKPEAFRCPKKITGIRRHRSAWGIEDYPICPTCGRSLQREFQPFCSHCGQFLDWSDINKADLICI